MRTRVLVERKESPGARKALRWVATGKQAGEAVAALLADGKPGSKITLQVVQDSPRWPGISSPK